MIVQGTNVPLAVTFDEDISDIPTLVATLWLKDGTKIKEWDKNAMEVDGATVYLPLTEAETANIMPGFVALEIKGLTEDNQTVFWEQASVEVTGRRDRVITLTV